MAAQVAPVTSIIPAPMKAEARDGQFKLTSEGSIIADDGLRDTAKLLAERLRPASGFRLKIKSPGKEVSAGDIVLTTKGADAKLGPEGYQLSVRPTSVIIRASKNAGILYGEQSLLQLLPADIFSSKPIYDGAWTAPCVEISDAPRFAWRGLLLDVARHFYTKAEVEQVLDLVALYKLNTFHWHLVDDQGWRIEIKQYPDLTRVGAWRDGIEFDLDPKSSTAYDKNGRYGGFYTQSDIHEIVAYAAARHITIVPEIEMPGHSGAALGAYPQFGCPGVKTPGVYCVGNDATFTFVSNILAEVARLFPAQYIHIGGDEVNKANWKACPLCQALIKNEGLKNEHELQSYFIRRVEKIVNAQRKTLIGWSEIREGGLAPNAVLMDWIGGGAESASSGHDVVMTPTKYCYIDYYQSTNHAGEPKAIGGFVPLQQVYQFEPVPEALAPEFRSHVLGGQANLWTEYVANLRHAEYMMFPRLEALAEVTWSPKDSRDWENFKSRVALNEKRLDALGVNYRALSKP
jgi:hexosaminidase